MKNRLAPINQIPPEVLTLIPDSWDLYYRHQADRALIALTHVCQTWRGIFTSRPSLWTDFTCEDTGKTRVYLERSRSSPINLRLERKSALSPHDPFLEILPHAIGRLKSLSVGATAENLQDITAHLTRPAPLLERLDINGGSNFGPRKPTLTAALFDGDFPSLRELFLEHVHTELPWRNMINLTSFILLHISLGNVPIGQLLDFFEGAPHLREVKLYTATPTSGGQNGRLVPLACLRRMEIKGVEPSSLLLDHLLIPVGARLTIHIGSFGDTIEDHLPRSLDNLRNLSNFTDVYVGDLYPRMRFVGPNGQLLVTMSQPDTTCVAEHLARFDTSKTERLEVANSNCPSRNLLYQALLPMENLRTLALSRWRNSHVYVRALDPNTSLPNVVVCPKLEELIIVPRNGLAGFDVGSVTEMARARASRGVKLRVIRILSGQNKLDPGPELELRKYVWHVEYGPEADVVSDDGDGSDED